jgi:hypothetical protein
VPVILYFGKAITPSGDGSCTSGNASHCGAVGQKVSLSSQVNSNLFISTQSWSIQGTAIAGFTAPAAPNYAGGEQVSQLLIFSNPSISFYWITTGGSSPASYQVKYSYCLINNQCNSATATFSVEGPIPPGNGDAVVTKTFPAFIRIAHGGEFMGIGIGIVPGIEFRADNFTIPNDNQGSFQWVQVIDTDKITTWQPPGTKSSCSPFDPQGGTPQLDNSYPYGNGFPGTVTTDCPQCVPNNRATDSPGSSLAFLNGETQHIFSATMYLEWTPNKDSACTTGNDCTIPVPMGNIPWKWEGDAINTKQTQGNTTTWSFASGCPKPGTVENPKFTKPNISFPNFGYVTWNGKTQNNTCR